MHALDGEHRAEDLLVAYAHARGDVVEDARRFEKTYIAFDRARQFDQIVKCKYFDEMFGEGSSNVFISDDGSETNICSFGSVVDDCCGTGDAEASGIFESGCSASCNSPFFTLSSDVIDDLYDEKMFVLDLTSELFDRKRSSNSLLVLCFTTEGNSISVRFISPKKESLQIKDSSSSSSSLLLISCSPSVYPSGSDGRSLSTAKEIKTPSLMEEI